MIVSNVETFAGFLEELKPILPSHYEELALEKDKVPLDPQYEVYLQKEKQGEVIVVTLRETNKLIGYFIGFVAPGLHYKTCLTCHMDIFYVVKEWRGHGAGFILFRAVEEELKRRKVQRMYVGSKLHNDCSFLFEKLGYKLIENTYSVWLA